MGGRSYGCVGQEAGMVADLVQIERRIAPFWRGLNDHESDWTEHQLVAAARGLPIPAADEIPPEDPARPSSPNMGGLMVPTVSKSQSYASDASANLSASHPAFSIPSPSPPTDSPSQTSFSAFRPRSKTLASLTNATKNPSQTDIVPREVQLPNDPYVNGQAMEAFLYKDAEECPICFIYYPPYLNKTRCCDQAICSECFVQIKRPDPHIPEQDHNEASDPAAPNPTIAAEPDQLVSEPSCCPYCQQAEFGVTFEPPPFRRGLIHAGQGAAIGTVASAMSSSSSINSSNGQMVVPPVSRRRTTSLSANASTVITTDRIRPDWATKLANARNHAARRSAAATALHTAAYLTGGATGAEGRGFAFTSRSRFGRSRGDSGPDSGAATPSQANGDPGSRALSNFAALSARDGQGSASARRRSRMDDLEEMMMMEAIRLSLAAEEERSKKDDKEAKKEAKKKEKEAKKAEKAAEKASKKSMYGASSGSGSALSLTLTGRRRGDSGSSNLGREISNSNDKGKSVDRGNSEISVTSSSLRPSSQGAKSPPAPLDFGRTSAHKTLDANSTSTTLDNNFTSHSPTATGPQTPSLLRHMSTASSRSSSFENHGSRPASLHPHGSSSSLDSHAVNASATMPSPSDDGDADGREPMFNFGSLERRVIGEADDEGEKSAASEHVEHLEGGGEGSESAGSEGAGDLGASVATLRAGANGAVGGGSGEGVGQVMRTPEVVVTPGTPALMTEAEEDDKQLGTRMMERGRGELWTQ